MKRFSRGDKIFLLVLSLVTFLFAGLLYSDMTRFNRSGEGEVIGTISFKQNVAQRRFQGTVVWVPLEQNAPLHNKDSIRTSNLSEAEITLNDGTKIDMDENSMVLLNLMGTDAELDFSYGRISTGGNLNIKAGDQVIRSRDSQISLSKPAGGEESESSVGGAFSMLVEKGLAIIEKDGKSNEIKESESATLQEDGNLKIKEQSVISIEPTNMAKFQNLSLTTPVKFVWKSQSKNNRLILSRYASLKEPWKILEVSSDSATLNLSPGNHYWKVTSGKDESEVRRVTVYPFESPTIYAPSNQSVLSGTGDKKSLTFSWSKSNFGTTYLVQVFRDESKTPIWEETTRVTSVNYSLPPGNYNWKVGIKSLIGDEVAWSKLQTFVIQKTPNLPTPAMIQPFRGSKSLVNVANQKGILFSWRTIPEAKQYNLEIMDSDSGKSLHTESTQSNHLLLKRDWKPGKYFWRIQAVNSNHQSEFSEALPFSVSESSEIITLSPAAGSQVYSSGLNPVVFRWNKIPSLGIYRVQLIDSQRKKQSKDSQNNILEWKDLDPGDYKWQVEFLEREGTKIAQSSLVEFTVKKGITPPALVQPTKNEKVDLTYANQIRFEWKPSPFVKFYRLEIYPQGKPEQIIYKEQTTSTIYFLKRLNRLTTGLFTWRVIALTKDGLESSSEPSDFEIFLNPDKGRLEFTSPETFYVE